MALPGRTAIFAVDELLDAFWQRARLEDPSDAPSPWQKVGVSIYDEVAVLGAPARAAAPPGRDWIDDILDDLEQMPGWAYEVESSGDESDDENPSGVADWDPERASRAAWAALAFCRSYRLPSDLPEPCSICLDTLCHGQEAWRLPCTHIFHAGCIARCFGMRVAELICPLCRCDIRRIAVSAPEEISVRAPVFAG